MGTTLLGVPNSSYIEIKPNGNTSFGEVLERQDHRTRAKALYTYIEPNTYNEWKLKLSWVGSSDKTQVNSWWKSATDLRFIPDDSFPSSFHTVRIMKGKEPFKKFVNPAYGAFNASGVTVYYSGEINIETV